MLLEGSCYSVEETTESGVDWSSGEKNCNSLGGHLVTIESSVVQSFLFWEVQRLRNLTLLTAGGVDSRPQLYWIGAHLDNKTHLSQYLPG